MKNLILIFFALIGFCSFGQSPGDVIVTELMFDPNGSNEQDREWFEVYNTTSSPIDMNGWTIGDNSSSGRDHLIDNGATPVIIPANSYAVFVYNDDPNVSIVIPNTVYEYGGGTGNSNSGFPTWNNESTYIGGSTNDDGIELISPSGVTIDNILYGFGYNGLNAGDILITEIMIDPNGTEENTEWIELYNSTDADIDIQGWIIGDSSSSGRAHEITESVIIAPNSYALLSPVADSNLNGGITNVAYAYGFNSPPGGTPTPGAGDQFPRFNNEGSFNDGTPNDNEVDGVFIVSTIGLELDRVDYDYGYGTAPIGFPDQGHPEGSSIELGFSFFDSVDNDDADSWGIGSTAFGSSGLGTPGQANEFNQVFIYDNAWLAPFNDISGNTNSTADLVVLNGNAPVTADTAVQSINVESTGSLIASPSIVLTVNENILSDGNIDATDAILFLNGDTTQNITGAGTVSIGIIDIDNVNGASNSAIVDLYGELAITTGNLDNTGTFTLKNTAAGTAVVNELVSGSSTTGDFKVERYIPVSTAADGRGFRFLSSPVTSTGTIYDNWQNAGANTTGIGTHITGVTGTVGVIDMATGFDTTANGAASAFQFSNDSGQTWQALTSTNQSGDVLNSMEAYRVFIRGDRDPSRIVGSVAANATTLSTTGTINQDDQMNSYAVNSGEFIFVGNPYQSPVDMGLVLANSDNINNDVVYYWDPNLRGMNGRGAYTTVSGFAGGGTATVLPASANSEFIQPGQAAFVVANASGNATIRFSESDKATSSELSSGTVFGINNPIANQLVVTLFDTVSLQANSSATDAVMLRVDNRYSSDNDDKDLLKLSNIDETMSLVGSDTRDYGIQSIPQIQDGLIIPLKMDNYGDSNYTFRIDVGSFAGFNVILEDYFLNTKTILNNNGMNEISFSINPSIGSDIASRFAISFENSTLSNSDEILDAITIYPNPVQNENVIINAPVSNLNIEVFNALGQRVYETISSSNRTVIPATGLNSGLYIVKMSNEESSTSLKLIIN